jgi:hypothetical protein
MDNGQNNVLRLNAEEQQKANDEVKAKQKTKQSLQQDIIAQYNLDKRGLTIPWLHAQLLTRGLDVKGRKGDLVERFHAAMMKELAEKNGKETM